MSETVDVKLLTIDDVLHSIQIGLKAPKNQYNSFGKYHYRNCEDILEAIKKIIPSGAVLIMHDDIVQVGDRFYVKAVANLWYKGEHRYSTAWAREPLSRKGMDESQITGGASSYARKYALNGLFLIDDSKDADTSDSFVKASDDRAETLKLFVDMVNRLKIDASIIQQWAELANVSQVRDASTEHLKRFIAKMKQKEEELNNV
jgi:hypothetical protein